MKSEEIATGCAEFRRQSEGQFQLNLWIPEMPPQRDPELERNQREYLAQWGPPVPAEAAESVLPNFDPQCQAMLDAAPIAISSIMGLYAPSFVSKMKEREILWFATATTVSEAMAAEGAGADAIVAQGMEAGGHRGIFDASEAEQRMVGLFALLPQVADAVSVPVIAAGGIADARGIAAALVLGASAVMIGTGFLRCLETKISPVWAERLAKTEAEDTMITRAFSGRPGRSIATSYVRASASADAPPPAPYPLQRGLTRAMRDAAMKTGDPERMQMWAGQSARLARAEPAADLTRQLWDEAKELLKES
jgi:nitronate monooxygenase